MIYLKTIKLVIINIKLGIYNVDHGKIFQVTIHPKMYCTCHEHYNCCHILAVMKANGRPIQTEYKTTNLKQLIRSKNGNKAGGRKMRGVAAAAELPELALANIIKVKEVESGTAKKKEIKEKI